MRSSLKNSFILITIMLILAGCRKDSLPDIDLPVDDTTCHEDWCDEIPAPNSMIGWQTVNTGPQYRMPEFNPNNPDEFVYVRDNGSGNTELVKYSINSNEETILCNSLFILKQPQWGKSGWITFSTNPWRVWKIYENGSQLTQLTFGENDQAPHFTSNGNLIYYDRSKDYTNYELDQNPDLYLESKMMVIDLDGNFVDSVMVENVNAQSIGINHYQRWREADIENDHAYFGAGSPTYNNYGIYSLNLTQGNLVPIRIWNPSIQGQQHLSYLCYQDGFIYYTKFRKGIFKTDVESGKEINIRVGCGMRYYDAISISPDGTKMLVEKVTTTVLNDYQLDEQREIWLFDLEDGCAMEKVLGE